MRQLFALVNTEIDLERLKKDIGEIGLARASEAGLYIGPFESKLAALTYKDNFILEIKDALKSKQLESKEFWEKRLKFYPTLKPILITVEVSVDFV